MGTGPWIYPHVSGVGAREVGQTTEETGQCHYCSSLLRDLGTTTRYMEYVTPITERDRELARRAGSPILDSVTPATEESAAEEVQVHRCPACGWWIARSHYLNTGGHVMEEIGYGLLRALDPTDIGEPVEAIRAYLMARYDDRFKIDPQKFEDVVCSIFCDLGYSARVTSYSADGGIDVYMDGPEDTLIGVQVKRYKNAIEIEQINALTGALLLKGCNSGVFVTTSRYRSGAVETARIAGQKGFPIELYDADRLYDALSVAQSQVTVDVADPDAPWMRLQLPTYYKILPD